MLVAARAIHYSERSNGAPSRVPFGEARPHRNVIVSTSNLPATGRPTPVQTYLAPIVGRLSVAFVYPAAKSSLIAIDTITIAPGDQTTEQQRYLLTLEEAKDLSDKILECLSEAYAKLAQPRPESTGAHTQSTPRANIHPSSPTEDSSPD